MWISHEINEQIKITGIFTIFERLYEKNFKFFGESHNFWECVYVQNGSVCVSADERIHSLHENDIIFHKPLEFHKFNIDGASEAKLFIFSFSCDGVLSESFKNKVYTLQNKQKEVISLLISFCRDKFRDSIKHQNSAIKENEINFMNYVKNDLQMVASYISLLLLMLADSAPVAVKSDSNDAEIFTKAVDYMKCNMDTMLCVSEISKHCNVSDSGMKRVFKKYAGIGIHKYFIKMKINSAIKLIESGISISEISTRLGFSSQGYFSSMFKRETGKSPSDFKNIF